MLQKYKMKIIFQAFSMEEKMLAKVKQDFPDLIKSHKSVNTSSYHVTHYVSCYLEAF